MQVCVTQPIRFSSSGNQKVQLNSVGCVKLCMNYEQQ